jgi:hypothetical protein
LRGPQLQCLAPIRPQHRQRQPRLPLPARPPTRPVRIPPTSARNLDDHALHFDHTCRLLIDGKPFRINTYAPPATVDSKPLTPTLSPLSATLTKNQGG